MSSPLVIVVGTPTKTVVPELVARNAVPALQVAAIARQLSMIAAGVANATSAATAGQPVVDRWMARQGASSENTPRQTALAMLNELRDHAEHVALCFPATQLDLSGTTADVVESLDTLLDLSSYAPTAAELKAPRENAGKLQSKAVATTVLSNISR